MSAPALLRVVRIFLLSLFTCLAAIAGAKDDATFLARGDAAYTRKAYDSAILYYEEAASGKTPDPTALYKLGNAHYRLRHLGEAMLCYERALLRQPGFSAAARNVRVIQQQVSPAGRKEIFFIRWWQAISAPEHSNSWAVLAMAIFAALLGMLAFSRYKRRKLEWLSPQLVGVSLGIACIFLVFSIAGVWRDVPQAQAVIMRPDTKFRPTTGSAKAGAIALPEGLLVKVLAPQKEEVIVALPDGQQGFVQKADIAAVE